MYVGRALYLKGYGAHLIMAVWSGILTLNAVSRQDNSCCYLENIIKSATSLLQEETSVSTHVVAISVSGFDFQSQLIL